MDNAALQGGFSNPPIESAHAFRVIMNVMARPGTIGTLNTGKAPEPLSAAAATLLLTLCDADTGVYLAGDADCEPLRDWLRFHTGAPIVEPSQATFAVGTWDALPLADFPVGIPTYPDRSTTVIIDHADLTAHNATGTGPGIKETATLSLPDIDPFRQNRALFPLGLDFYLTSGTQVSALPRSTEVTPCT